MDDARLKGLVRLPRIRRVCPDADVAVADPAAVGAQDAADERCILVVLDPPPPGVLLSTPP